jgi:AcrR family transcriptional regulator/DNA-binding MarR family transcriptional regulator
MAIVENANPVTVKERRACARPAHDHVPAFQRARMIAAAVETIEELGYARMTVAQVTARARVSRKTFYDAFVDREHCFLAACEHALSKATVLAQEAYLSQGVWSEAIRAALMALLVFFEEEPALARLLIVESLAAGREVSARRAQVLDELAEAVDSGRMARDLAYPPKLAGQAVVAGVLGVIHARLVRGGRDALTDLLGPLMSMIVLPYLGSSMGRRELERPQVPLGRTHGRPKASDVEVLARTDFRLTYRTVRALTVMANHPGASNKEIAERSGIADQGQVSKLLSRLARLGLAENLGGAGQQRAANAWHLTPPGARLERASRTL